MASAATSHSSPINMQAWETRSARRSGPSQLFPSGERHVGNGHAAAQGITCIAATSSCRSTKGYSDESGAVIVSRPKLLFEVTRGVSAATVSLLLFCHVFQ